MSKKSESQGKLDNKANAREACTDICTRGEQGKPCNHCEDAQLSGIINTRGRSRKTLRIRNVELEGNLLIQKACKALEMEATVTHLLEDNQADTRWLQVPSVTAATEKPSTICGAEGKGSLQQNKDTSGCGQAVMMNMVQKHLCPRPMNCWRNLFRW